MFCGTYLSEFTLNSSLVMLFLLFEIQVPFTPSTSLAFSGSVHRIESNGSSSRLETFSMSEGSSRRLETFSLSEGSPLVPLGNLPGRPDPPMHPAVASP